MTGAQYTDAEVASMVRMLMREQLDHEMICVLARDRIMALSARKLKCLFCDFQGDLAGLKAHSAQCESHPLWDRLQSELCDYIDRLNRRNIIQQELKDKLTQSRADLTAQAEELRVAKEDARRYKHALGRAFEGASRQLAEPRNHADDQFALTAIATVCEAELAQEACDATNG